MGWGKSHCYYYLTAPNSDCITLKIESWVKVVSLEICLTKVICWDWILWIVLIKTTPLPKRWVQTSKKGNTHCFKWKCILAAHKKQRWRLTSVLCCKTYRSWNNTRNRLVVLTTLLIICVRMLVNDSTSVLLLRTLLVVWEICLDVFASNLIPSVF